MTVKNTSYSLQPIPGKLDYGQARHLLNRCLFGAKKAEIDAFVGLDIASAMAILTTTPPLPDPPVSVDTRDTAVPLGSTWVNAPHNVDFNGFRTTSLCSWWVGNMMQQNVSLVEKMTLCWYNHFVTGTEVFYSLFIYQYNNLWRTFALGNVKQLAKEITVSPAMLLYLSGASNVANSPNENYARELFELFTIGKGPLIAEGNYTTYTELDIREAAKVLTGWRIDLKTWNSYFDSARHDTGPKVFSPAFAGQTISNQGAEEYKTLIEMIFQQKETARSFARKIYRWLMHYNISPEVEQQIIEPLATTLISAAYEIKPVLEQLLSSEHFFSSAYFGSSIKNPIEFTVGIYRKTEIPLSSDIISNYNCWLNIFNTCTVLEMRLNEPPNVAGWPAYYLAPSYSELWINTASIPYRTAFSDRLCTTGLVIGDYKYLIDPFVLALKLNNPQDTNSLISGLANVLLPVSLSPAQLTQLKEVLIPGLPDDEWTDEWTTYVLNPNDATQKSLVGKRILAVIAAIFRMPEFYLN